MWCGVVFCVAVCCDVLCNMVCCAALHVVVFCVELCLVAKRDQNLLLFVVMHTNVLSRPLWKREAADAPCLRLCCRSQFMGTSED